MKTLRLLPILVPVLGLAGCQQLSQPQQAPVEKPVVQTPPPDDDTRQRAVMAYQLLDAPFATVKLDTAEPVKVVIDVLVGGKDSVYKDWFLAGKGGIQGSTLTLSLRPVDNGELEKARRIRYGIMCGGSVITHLVKNPFMGLTSVGSLVKAEAKSDGTPVHVFQFSKKGLRPAPAKMGAAPVASPNSTVVRVRVYKATKEDLASGDPLLIRHEEAAVAPKPKKK